MHRLFFALQPNDSVAMQIAQATAIAKAAKFFRGACLQPKMQHITLAFLGDHEELPAAIVQRAQLAAATVKFAPFSFSLAIVASFRGRRPPCVLLASPGTDAMLQDFRQTLCAALVTAGLGAHLDRRFTPHLTLAYGDKAVAQRLPVEPIVWPVREFVLLDSRVGHSIHAPLGCWPLSA